MGNYNKLVDKINNEYDSVKLLKENEKSSVHIVKNRKSGERFVFKKTTGSGSAVYKNLMQISCKNLPKVVAAESDGEKTAVLEEYIFGDSLFEVLKGGLLSEKEATDLTCQLCKALSILHKRGMIHRDIKPENVLIRGNEAVLIDFDASREVSIEKTGDTKILGTTGYASPEQYGLSQTDARSDIYSLGVMLNVMLTGEHPSTKLAEGYLGEIVEQCTMINPERRFQTAEELEKALNIKKNTKKINNWKILSAIFAAIICIGIVLSTGVLQKNQSGFKTPATIVESGFCGTENGGKNLEWTFYSDGVLKISGTGKMADFESGGAEEPLAPWKAHQGKVISLVIEEGVESIGKEAFRHMLISGENLVLPSTLKEIRSMAFCKNNFSGKLMIPEGTELLEGCAFQLAGSFSEIYIPSTVTEMGETPFRYCNADKITVHEDNPAFSSKDGVLYTKDFENILQFPQNVKGDFTLPLFVRNIGSAAFESSELNTIVISGKIDVVGAVAFQGFSGDVIFQNEVNYVNKGAFHNDREEANVWFLGGAPKEVAVYGNEEWNCFMGFVNVYYYGETDSWKLGHDGKWNGYEVSEKAPPYEEAAFVSVSNLGEAKGESSLLPPDFYDYWKKDEIITENIFIDGPGNLEKYISVKFEEDVLIMTLEKVPDAEWKNIVESVPEWEEGIILSLVTEAPDEAVTGFVTNNGNGPTYSNLKRRFMAGEDIAFSSFDGKRDKDYVGIEVAQFIDYEGETFISPIDRNSVFYKAFLWKDSDGNVTSKILPYRFIISQEFKTASVKTGRDFVQNEIPEHERLWMESFWEPITDPKRIVLMTMGGSGFPVEIEEAKAAGVDVEFFEEPGFVFTKRNRNPFDPDIAANIEASVLPPDARNRKAGESLEEYLDSVYSETKYKGCKIVACSADTYTEELAESQNNFILGETFFPIENRRVASDNILETHSVETENGTLFYGTDMQNFRTLIIDWYTENPDKNPGAAPEKREFVYFYNLNFIEKPIV